MGAPAPRQCARLGSRHPVHDSHYGHDGLVPHCCGDPRAAQETTSRLEDPCSSCSEARILLGRQSVRPGESFADRITAGLSRALCYLLPLPQASIKAEWPTAERDAALPGDPSRSVGGATLPSTCRSLRGEAA